MVRNLLWATLQSVWGTIASTWASPADREDSWTLARTEENDSEVLYRVRSALPDKATMARNASLAVVDLIYPANSKGMPDRKVSENMDSFEISVEEKFESTGLCSLAFTRIGDGKKQWNYYVSDSSEFSIKLKAEAERNHLFSMQIHIYADPSWQALKKAQNALRK